MSNSQHYCVTLLFAISIYIFCKTIDIAYYFTSNLVPSGAALFSVHVSKKSTTSVTTVAEGLDV
jgi:hypothetical protein